MSWWKHIEEPDVGGTYQDLYWGPGDHEDYPDHEELPDQRDYIRDREWDVLVVLDACRWDALDLLLPDHEVEAVRSPSHNTPNWLNDVWSEYDNQNLKYVSGSPMSQPNNPVNPVIEDYDLNDHVNLIQATNDGEHGDGAWDGILGTSRPSILEDISRHYDKPQVVHFMQPHTPYIGDVVLQIRGRASEAEITGDGPSSLWNTVLDGRIDIELVQLAYVYNLKYALKHVDKLLDHGGTDKIAITADHGEVINEDRCGHGGRDTRRTRSVPWCEMEVTL